MTERDPAVEAAQRARENNAYGPTYEEVAREALAPIRETVEKYRSDYIGGFSIDDLIADLEPLIYTTEELENTDE